MPLQKTGRILGLIALFFGSFLFFLYLTFPYEVLKESLATEISQATGMSVRIGELGPKLPLGVVSKKVAVTPAGSNKTMMVDELTVRISVLSFLVGNISPEVVIEMDKGTLELNLAFGIFSFFGKGAGMPSRVLLDAKEFPIGNVIAFGLNSAASSPTANPLVAPLLSAIGMTGRLNGNVKLKLNSSDATQSSGSADIMIRDAVLKLSDPSLGLTDQSFTTAMIKASLSNGSLVVDEGSGFVAEELQLKLNGKMAVKASLQQSQFDMNVLVKLDKDLRDKLGFILDTATGGSPRNGEVTLQVRGPMTQPTVTPF